MTKWYPQKPVKKRVRCIVCNDSGKVKDQKTGEERDCVLCVKIRIK
jgi:hypothetical protein